MVNRKRIEMLRVLFATGSNTLALLSVLCVLYVGICRQTPKSSLLLLAAAYALVTSCTRNGTQRVVPFLLLHLLPFPLWWILPGISGADRVFGVGACIGICGYSMIRKYRRERMTAIPIAVLFGILWAMDLITGRVLPGASGREQMVFAYLGLVCFLGESYLARFLHYLEMEARTNAEIPEKSLFRQGGLLAFAYSVFLLLSLFLFTSKELAQKAGGWISRLLRGVIGFFLSLLPRGSEETVEELVTQTPPPQLLPELAAQTESEPFWAVVMLEKLMMGAVAAGLIVLCAAAVYWIVRQFLEAFQKEAEREDQIEDLHREEKQERLERRKENGGLRRFFGARTPEEKIRRSYQRLVERTASREEREHVGRETVREYLGQHAHWESGDREALAALYEKARYSGKECSAKEGSEAAAIVRSLSGR